MEHYLRKIVEIATEALSEEDKYLLDALKQNKVAYPSESGGLLCIDNERYYQFIIFRKLIMQYEFPVSIEKDRHDLVVYDKKTRKKYKAVSEMKRWMSAKGEKEILEIQSDLKKLLESNAQNSLMLIFSANPRKQSARDNLKWLAERLSIAFTEESWFWLEFPTKSKKHEEITFWVAGYQVK